MNQQTKEMVRKWVEKDNGDWLRTARWMRDNLNICGLKQARELVKEAMTETKIKEIA